jgi:hypothetical protein
MASRKIAWLCATQVDHVERKNKKKDAIELNIVRLDHINMGVPGSQSTQKLLSLGRRPETVDL